MKKLVIAGAGEHGRVAKEVAEETYDEVILLDDNLSIPGVKGAIKDCEKYKDCDFFVAIGDNTIRKNISSFLQTKHCEIVSLISAHSTVSPSAVIGKGTLVLSGAVVCTGAEIGEGVILNTCCSVDHDCVIGDFSHISVGSHLAGVVSVGADVLVGCGACVIPRITIADHAVVGAGAVVVKDITESGTYIGVPARKK